MQNASCNAYCALRFQWCLPSYKVALYQLYCDMVMQQHELITGHAFETTEILLHVDKYHSRCMKRELDPI